jgi:hypothetical protein
MSTTCYYCDLEHPRVEAGGIYYCPNFLCTGPGGAPHRRKLASYAEGCYPKSGHTVDEEEWQRAGLAHADTLDATDPPLAARIRQDVAVFPDIVERRRIGC